jgi:hypothetical protein
VGGEAAIAITALKQALVLLEELEAAEEREATRAA